MEIYLDNSATTRVCNEAVDAMMKMLTENYGNPSSLHKKGTDASIALENARESVAEELKCKREEIYFTGSGTTANNTAIFGSVPLNGRKGGRIITSSLEHPSVGEAMKRLAGRGFDVVYLKPDKTGAFSVDELMNAIDDNTLLVSIMAVNNETGSINPIREIKKSLKRKNTNALIHVDAVQAIGKIPLNPAKDGIDLMSVSSHKIHGPKGAGALYVRKGVKLVPHIIGGGQEKGIYSGTEAMPAIAGFGAAVKALPNTGESIKKIQVLRDAFVCQVSKIPGVYINSPEGALPYIVNISVIGVPSQTMVNALSAQGICVSAGSA